MSILARAKEDIESITSDIEGFAREITLTAPDSTVLVVNGLHTKHHLGADSDGNLVNTKNAHISISEKFLSDASYPYRDSQGEVNLKKHKVSVKDSTDVEKIYVIREWFPNETIGLITCILKDYDANL